MSETRYKVVLLNQLSDNMDRGQIIKNLAALFKSTEAKIEQILSKPETTIKKEANKATADKFHTAISKAGAACKLVEIKSDMDFELPEIQSDIPKANTTADITEHQDPTRQEIPSLESEQSSQLSLEEKKLDESQTKQEDSDITNASISEDRLCPVCGTIKASADSACVHCGYNPISAKADEKKALIKKIAGISLAIIVVCAGIGIPAFNYFSHKMKVEEGFLLAFDTRNKIETFASETGFWPNQNIDANLPKSISNDVIESITIGDKSVMTVTVRASITGSQEQTLIFAPKLLKGQIVWNCLKGTLENSLRPELCKRAE
jgi:hypothetical protein